MLLRSNKNGISSGQVSLAATSVASTSTVLADPLVAKSQLPQHPTDTDSKSSGTSSLPGLKGKRKAEKNAGPDAKKPRGEVPDGLEEYNAFAIYSS